MIFNACQKEEFATAGLNQNQPEFVESRLHFKTAEQLADKINRLKKLSETDLQNEMSKFYKKGFKPLKPFYSENDIGLIQEYSFKKIQTLKNSSYSELDDDDELIADDFFAAVLNENCYKQLKP